MKDLLHKTGRFLNNMDAKAMTSLGVTIVLLGFVAVMLVYGTDWLGINQKAVNNIMDTVSQSPFAILGVIVLFCGLALTGFPQTFLFAATAAVFGATQGALFSWVATLCSASLTFFLGNLFGARFVKKLSAGRAQTMIRVVQRHGLLAAMIIRWIPSAPFIVVNSVFGVANVPWWKFIIGTAIGIIPKIVVVSFFTDQIDDLLGFFKSHDPKDLIGVAVLIVVWLIFLLFVRWLYMRLRQTTLADIEEDAITPAKDE